MKNTGLTNLIHLPFLFNITTPAVDIWSEKTADYRFSGSMCQQKTTTSMK